MHDSEWNKASEEQHRQMIENGVTQLYRQTGTFCGEFNEQWLQHDRYVVEVYLEDIQEYVARNNDAFKIKKTGKKTYCLKAWAAWQIAVLIYLNECVQEELLEQSPSEHPMFIIGARTRHIHQFELESKDPNAPASINKSKNKDAKKEGDVKKSSSTQYEARVNILGDRHLHRLLSTSEKAKKSMAPYLATAESRLQMNTNSETMEFYNGSMKHMFTKKHLDLPDPQNFTAQDLPKQIQAYYDLFYGSEVYHILCKLTNKTPVKAIKGPPKAEEEEVEAPSRGGVDHSAPPQKSVPDQAGAPEDDPFANMKPVRVWATDSPHAHSGPQSFMGGMTYGMQPSYLPHGDSQGPGYPGYSGYGHPYPQSMGPPSMNHGPMGYARSPGTSVTIADYPYYPKERPRG